MAMNVIIQIVTNTYEAFYLSAIDFIILQSREESFGQMYLIYWVKKVVHILLI